MSDETTPGPGGWKNILLALANDPGPDERDAAADELATELADARTELQKQDAEIRRLQDLISRMRADYHTETRQRAEAYQAAIASTAGDALEHRLCGMNLHAAIRRAEQAEAAIARVRGIHPRETTGFGSDVCGICFNEHEDSATWPCPTIAALDQLADSKEARG